MTVRVRIENWIIKKLKQKYVQKVLKEHGIILTDSQIVYIALLEFEAYQNNEELDINFTKNGKITYKFR
jgi:DNA-directed RNA polymerase subunit E'/Rpb7